MLKSSLQWSNIEHSYNGWHRMRKRTKCISRHSTFLPGNLLSPSCWVPLLCTRTEKCPLKCVWAARSPPETQCPAESRGSQSPHRQHRQIIPVNILRSFTFFGSMLNFFLPIATCLLFCRVLLQSGETWFRHWSNHSVVIDQTQITKDHMRRTFYVLTLVSNILHYIKHICKHWCWVVVFE